MITLHSKYTVRGAYVIGLGILILLSNCGLPKKKVQITVEETAGIARDLEYVQITLPGYTQDFVIIKEMDDNRYIQGEKTNNSALSKNGSTYLFPISINAWEKKTYSVTSFQKRVSAAPLDVKGEGAAFTVENDYFRANFGITDQQAADGLYPGQLSTMLLKRKQVLLERDGNNIHWSPNFQKEGLEYKTVGHMDTENLRIVEQNPYLFSVEKSGNVKGYEEIDLTVHYTFYANLPYFIYTSNMEMKKDVALTLLRNDEMTMNRTFTHLIFPDSSGAAAYIPLYGTSQLDSLKNSPLHDNITWVGFVNKDKSYGLISLRLGYDNKNLQNESSPLHEPHTQISVGADEGRYWNRRLINDTNTLVPKGSRYHEKNAYLVIEDMNEIGTQIDDLLNSYKNPLKISFSTE
ncbi:MAG: hypothetical protein V7724_12840 [Sediminicola sp.]